jgi:hypothetical protein
LRFASQTKIPIRGVRVAISIQSQPTTHRKGEVNPPRSNFEDCSTFVHLIKLSTPNSVDDGIGNIFVRLFPHEMSATSRDGVDRWSGDSLTFEVVPTEPRPHGGHVQDVVILTILCITLNKESVISIKLIRVLPSSHMPRLDPIQRIVNIFPLWSGPGITDPITPLSWNPTEDKYSILSCSLRFKPVDKISHPSRVINHYMSKSYPKDVQYGQSILTYVLATVGDFFIVHEHLPIGL